MMEPVRYDASGTAFTDAGAGAPVVLIHGVGLSHRIWAEVEPHLLRGRRVITLDMLGHGASPRPPENAAITDYSAQALRLMDHLALERAAVVGFSMGALVGQQMALDAPHRVSQLAFVSGVHARTPAERAAILERARTFAERGLEPFIPGALERWLTPAFRAAHPEAEREIAAGLRNNDLAAYLLSYRVFATSDDTLAPRAGEVRCPTLVLTGEHDSGSTPAMAHAFAQRVPGSRVVILQGLRHLLTTEAPALLARHLDEFLERAA